RSQRLAGHGLLGRPQARARAPAHRRLQVNLSLRTLSSRIIMASIQVPALGESISEAIVAQWLKRPGDAVAVDEPVVELETDKVTVEVPSPVAGVLRQQLTAEGETVNVGDVIAEIEEGATATAGASADAEATADA